MPYSSIDDLDKDLKNVLPKHAQSIYMRAFNSAVLDQGKSEDVARRIAWAAVKRKYRKGEDGKWHPISSNRISFNRTTREDCGEFWKYPDVVVTKRGVMNKKYKSNEMIDGMYAPPVLPIVVDHPESDYPTIIDILELPQIGIGINMRKDTKDDERRTIYDFMIPKILKNTNDRMEDDELNEVSIVYSPECDELDEDMEYNGKQYNAIEKAKRLYHVAVMDMDHPACTLDDGCGIPCGCNKNNKEVNNMDETETPEKLELSNEETSEVSEQPIENPQSETVEEPTQEEEEVTEDEHVTEEPPVVEPPKPEENKKPCEHIAIIAGLNKEIESLKAKIEEMTPGYNSFIENQKKIDGEFLAIINSKVPNFNRNGMTTEQLEQLAIALNKEEAEKAKKIDTAKKVYSQMNNRESISEEILSIAEINTNARKKIEKKIRGE